MEEVAEELGAKVAERGFVTYEDFAGELRSAEQRRDAAWQEAVESWKRCSSKRLSWTSGGHCSYCSPLQTLLSGTAPKAPNEFVNDSGNAAPEETPEDQGAAGAAFPPSSTERENGRGPWYWVRAEQCGGPEEPVYHLSDGRGGMRCRRDIPGRVVKEEPYHPSRRCMRCKASYFAALRERAPPGAPPATALSADPARMQEEIQRLTGALLAAEQLAAGSMMQFASAEQCAVRHAARAERWRRRAKRLVGLARDAQFELTAKTIRYAALVSVMTEAENKDFNTRIKQSIATRRALTSAASAPTAPPSPAEAGLREIQERQELDRAPSARYRTDTEEAD